MASELELEEIRRRVDIADLISHYVTLKRAGANFKALCPFHEERTGSLMISPEKQIFKCFGCSESGDIFGFIMKMEGLNFPEAIRFLADRAGVRIEDTFVKNELTEKRDDKNRLLAINELATKYYQKILVDHPIGAKAKEYLYKRGINDESIKQFRLGFAPSQKGLSDLLLKRGYTISEIGASGKPDRFYNRIMFPICDPMGNVIAFTGREFPDNNGPKYLNTAETVLYHKSRALYGLNHAKIALRQKQAVIFVEGQMDVISSHQLGVQNTIASSGTALTADHMKIMYRYAQHFTLAFDNDEAGRKATEKVIDLALSENYITDVIVFPEKYKDAGEIIEKEPEIWQKLVAKAIPAVQWHFDRAFSLFDTQETLNGTQKKQIAGRLLPIIRQIRDGVEQAHYLQKLSKRLAIPEEILRDSMKQHDEKKTDLPVKTEIKPSLKVEKMEKLGLEAQIIGQIFSHPNLAVDFIDEIDEQYFTKAYLTIVKELKIWYNKSDINKEKVQTELISYLRAKLDEPDKTILNKIINESLDPTNELDTGGDDDSIEAAIKQTLEHLHKNYYENQKLDFARGIAEAEEAGDRHKVKELLKDLQKFLQNSGGKNG